MEFIVNDEGGREGGRSAAQSCFSTTRKAGYGERGSRAIEVRWRWQVQLPKAQTMSVYSRPAC